MCRMSKCDSQKPESMRRSIFNWGSTLQLIVQISSRSINSSVRARAKAHGRTPVSIELPKGRYLSSNACIFWARTPAFQLRKSAQYLATNAYIYIAQERTHTCARQKD